MVWAFCITAVISVVGAHNFKRHLKRNMHFPRSNAQKKLLILIPFLVVPVPSLTHSQVKERARPCLSGGHEKRSLSNLDILKPSATYFIESICKLSPEREKKKSLPEISCAQSGAASSSLMSHKSELEPRVSWQNVLPQYPDCILRSTVVVEGGLAKSDKDSNCRSFSPPPPFTWGGAEN